MRLRLERAATLMEVDLPHAEARRMAAVAERFQPHTEHARVEVDSRGVVEVIDHGFSLTAMICTT